MRLSTTEKVVGNRDGIYTVYSIQRKPEGERYSMPKLQEIRGAPWGPNQWTERRVEQSGQIRLDPEMPDVPARPPEEFEQRPVYRSHYIVRAGVVKYGFTAGYPACEDMRTGHKRRGGVSHTQTCRESHRSRSRATRAPGGDAAALRRESGAGDRRS